MNKKIFLYILLLSLYLPLFIQCENGDKTIDCFPKSTINYQVNLDLPAYQNLAGINGWAYVPGGPLSGTNGLIIVRKSTYEFIAYDRNAPHICPTANSVLEVKDDIYIYCPEDNAKWILNSGQPLKVASISPKTYPTHLIGNTLYISY